MARWLPLLPALLVLLVLSPALGYFPDEIDAYDAFLVGHMGAHGLGSAWAPGESFWLHENVCRLVSPLSWILRTWLFGAWTEGWYAVALLLHAGSAVLVARIGLAIGLGPLRATLASALFALTAIHARTVLGLGRDFDLFATVFTLGAVLSVERRRVWLGVMCATLAAMSKESGVMAGPLAVLWALSRVASGDKRALLRQLWPVAAASAVVLAVRVIQVGLVGSLEHAALPGKVLGTEARWLLVDGPLFIGYAIVAPLGLWLTSAEAGGVGLGLLAGVAALSRASRVTGLVALAFAALLPVLLVHDPGAPTDLSWLVANARYAHTPLAFLALALAHVPVVTMLGRSVLLGLFGLAGWGALELGVELGRRGQDHPSARRLVADLATAPKGQTPLVIEAEGESSVAMRVALSQWMALRLGRPLIWTARGTGQAWQRRPGDSWLDFGEGYLAPVDAPSGGAWYRLGPAPGDRLRSVPAPARGPKFVSAVVVAALPVPGARVAREGSAHVVTVNDAPPWERASRRVLTAALPQGAQAIFLEIAATAKETVPLGAGWLRVEVENASQHEHFAVPLRFGAGSQTTTVTLPGALTAAASATLWAPAVPCELRVLRIEALTP